MKNDPGIQKITCRGYHLVNGRNHPAKGCLQIMALSIIIPCQRNSNFKGKAYMELSAPMAFDFYFGPKANVIHQNWGPRSSRSHFSILGLKNWENSKLENK